MCQALVWALRMHQCLSRNYSLHEIRTQVTGHHTQASKYAVEDLGPATRKSTET